MPLLLIVWLLWGACEKLVQHPSATASASFSCLSRHHADSDLGFALTPPAGSNVWSRNLRVSLLQRVRHRFTWSRSCCAIRAARGTSSLAPSRDSANPLRCCPRTTLALFDGDAFTAQQVEAVFCATRRDPLLGLHRIRRHLPREWRSRFSVSAGGEASQPRQRACRPTIRARRRGAGVRRRAQRDREAR